MDTEYEYKFQLQKQLTTGQCSFSSNVGDAYINGVYTGLSFRSLLTYGFSDPVPYDYNMDHVPDPYSPPYLLSLLPPPQNDKTAKSPKLEMARQAQRKRRQRLSDRAGSLQKLLPQDKKMDMATVLEESYKYIKFLEAQVRVLQSMPRVTVDGYGFAAQSSDFGGVVGDLWRLNRQELLQVVVNSPAAQAVLYSNGCCVYSLEQLVAQEQQF